MRKKVANDPTSNLSTPLNGSVRRGGEVDIIVRLIVDSEQGISFVGIHYMLCLRRLDLTDWYSSLHPVTRSLGGR